MAVKFYVGAVAAIAAATGATAITAVPGRTQPPLIALVVLFALVVMSELLVIRYYHAGEIHALNLMEGVLATLVFVGSGTTVVTVTALGLAAANLSRRNPPVKALFNVSQWVIAAAIGAVVFHAIAPAAARDGWTIAALVAVMVLMALVNLVAITGVVTLASGSRVGSGDRRELRSVVVGHLASNIASIIAGVCLCAAYLWHPWVIVVGVPMVVAMHLAGRASASLAADGARLAGMHDAAHVLTTSLDVDEAVPRFLAAVRSGFDVSSVELVLMSDHGTMTYGLDDDTATTMTGPHELAGLLATMVGEPTHVEVGTGALTVSAALERSGHQRLLAAPLNSGGSTVGMLLLYDRMGMEGFEDGELTVAGALAGEFVGFLERVDLLHAVEEERRKLADILESTSDGILSIDADGVVTSWNAGLVSITGHSAEEMVGTRHFGLLRPRDHNGRDIIIERWLDVVDSSTGLPSDIQIVTADGRTVWLSCSYSRIPAAEERGDVLVVVARNITQARELERLKDDFVAVVSHELRTPLVPIKGWAQTLINRGDRLTDDQRRTAVQSILAQAQKLESLVLNILEASRIEAGRADGGGITDVGAVTLRIVEDTLAARPDRVMRIRPPSVPCQVRGSAVWVERAVSNLVANAVKYSPDDEAVDVAVFVDGSDVVVSVTDRGPGIPSDAHERIFDRFERLEESGKQAGTGLGLYITRRLARAMGGDVSVSSVPGAGSSFLLRLPVAAVPVRLPDQRSGERETSVVNLR